VEVTLNPQQRIEKAVHFSDTDLPGIFSISAGSLILDKFAVNLDPDESNTTPADEVRREKILKRFGVNSNNIHTISQPSEIQHSIIESRLGAELWKQFLIAALLIAIIEMFIARDSKRALASATKQI
jgi:hypothetical protein